MSFIGSRDFGLECALGRVPGHRTINKYGRATNCDSEVFTDIWDGANLTDDIAVWLWPTAPRVHSITSDDADDTLLGTGAQKIRIFGLPDWDTAEISEEIEMDGLTGANTVNSYVIVHRMQVIQTGSSCNNEGNIKATAAVDATLTAMISAGAGQTLMAIYGVPSTQSIAITRVSCSVLRDGQLSNVRMDYALVLIQGLDQTYTHCNYKDVYHTSGTSGADRYYALPKTYPGPCIVKMNTVASANDTRGVASFDAYLVDKD